MANSKQAKKRAKQADKARLHNNSRKSDMRTYIKRTLKAVADGKKELAVEEFKAATSKLDKLAQSKVIHKNTAARQKSRILAKIKKLFS